MGSKGELIESVDSFYVNADTADAALADICNQITRISIESPGGDIQFRKRKIKRKLRLGRKAIDDLKDDFCKVTDCLINNYDSLYKDYNKLIADVSELKDIARIAKETIEAS
jgi:hypothetical protein